MNYKVKIVSYIIGTGWWCGKESDTNRKTFGSEAIRGKDFHKIWSESIKRTTTPDRILMIDSASPVKPDLDSELPIKMVELNQNTGHSTNLKQGNKFCGWMSSVLLSLEYASLCECDYYVYVEQDVLLHGDDIIERCILESNGADYLFGRDTQRPQPLQQSFFIIKREAIDKFVSRIRQIKYSDAVMGPEFKFALATSPWFSLIPKMLFVQREGVFGKIMFRVSNILAKALGKYSYLQIGYGRERPINFSDSHYYFQHGTAEELERYMSSSISDK